MASGPANPYQGLPPQALWKHSVAGRDAAEIARALWRPKFQIQRDSAISTFGSCFAQHIGQALKRSGCNWLITESAPEGLDEETGRTFGYGIFSCRTGNIYTTSLLRQWTRWAADLAHPPAEIWRDGERCYDPFRPAVEPNGFATERELLALRRHTIERFRDCIAQSSFFVFTLGLTESWFHRDGYEYPLCPGTAAGAFDASQHSFQNQDYGQVHQALRDAIQAMREINRSLKFILTVSPVPLIATMSGGHVLPATTESKSILRAVAGELARTRDDVDYFPSYEIITSPVFEGRFFEANRRNVTRAGVDLVMQSFMGAAQLGPGAETARPDAVAGAAEPLDEVCEEVLLLSYPGHANAA